jgi:hypothetical protein
MIRSSIFSGVTGKAFVVLLLMFYGVQHLVHLFLPVYFSLEYKFLDDLSFAPLGYGITLLALISFVDQIMPLIKYPRVTISRNTMGFYIVFVYFLPLVYTGIWFYYNAGISFRYDSRLSDFGPVAYILAIEQFIFRFHVFITIATIYNSRSLSYSARYFLFFCTLFFGLTISSTLDLLIVFVGFWLSLNPSFFTKLLFKKTTFSGFKTFILLCGISVILVSMLFFGFANKEGVESASFRILESYDDVLGVVFARLSSGYATVISLSSQLEFLNLNSQGLAGTWDTFLYRFNVLFGIDQTSRLVTDSVARLNYMAVYKDYLHRAGASPGPLGSLFYFPFMPLSLLVHALYYLLILRLIQRYIRPGAGDPSMYGIIIFCLPILPFVENPFEYAEVIGPPTAYLACFIIGCNFKVRVKRSRLGVCEKGVL